MGFCATLMRLYNRFHDQLSTLPRRRECLKSLGVCTTVGVVRTTGDTTKRTKAIARRDISLCVKLVASPSISLKTITSTSKTSCGWEKPARKGRVKCLKAVGECTRSAQIADIGLHTWDSVSRSMRISVRPASGRAVNSIGSSR
jgi:hypothetical protein